MKTANKNLRVLITLCLALFITAIYSGANAQTKAERIDELLNQYHDYKLFNGTALVVEDGKVIFEKGYGFADKDAGTPNETDTKFRIGSITKQFIAMVIMQMVQEGKISLDDKLTKYIPEYRKDTGDEVIIHHLLTHTSGIRSYTNIPGFWRDSTSEHFSKDHLIKYAHAGDFEFEPGTDYNYNNTGYYLLGIIAERVDGKNYEEVLEERIFKPLGMNNTGVEREENLPGKRAKGYLFSADGLVDDPYFYMPNALGAGDMYSTVGDLYKWDRALYTDKLLSEENRKTMFTPFLANYAYGWAVLNKDSEGPGQGNEIIYVHTGGINGFNTIIARFVDNNNLIVLFNNTGSARLQTMTKGINAILHDKEYDMPKKPFTYSLLSMFTEGKDSTQVMKWYRNIKENHPGEYYFNENELNNSGYELMFSNKIDEAITVFRINVEEYPESFNVYDSMGEAYMNNGENDLAIELYEKSIELNPANNNGIEMLKKLGVEKEVPEIKVSEDILKKYTGKYQLTPDFSITITVEDGKIYEQATGQQKFEIFPSSETDFFMKVVSARFVFQLDSEGNATGLTLYQNGQELPGEKVE